MAGHFPLVFSSPHLLQVALAMVALLVLIAKVRKINVNRVSRFLILLGSILLAIAAGEPIWSRATNGTIAVLVDLSPSTRGATFRDRDALDLRIHQLLGNLPYQAFAYSDHNQPLPAGKQLADLPADQTLFSPPNVDAVLLFSDGQFSLPATAPPTYPVIDPVLNHPADAAVTDLKSLGHQVLAEVKRENSATRLTWIGATADKDQPLQAEPSDANQVTASLPPSDLWPENDSLSLSLPPPSTKQNWWIGTSAPAGWRIFSADELPTETAEFLQPSIIVLNNISADALSSAQQQRLLQYVRDLGGALLIVGGDRAFAAGRYDGTLLEKLSPLSSSPPMPAQKWLLLIDGSGSMAGDPWQTEIAVISRLLPQLPPHDAVTVGSFAKSLSIWATTSVPSNIFPTGPTNLAAALQQIIADTDGSSPTQLLMMTDADTELSNPLIIAAGLNEKKIHLHLLAIGQGKALPALKTICALTGGSMLEQLDPRQWIHSATQLLRSALPDHIQHSLVEVTPPPPSSVSDWNQTWLKPTATALQKTSSAAMTARWKFGLGNVISMAYPADPNLAVTFAKQIATPPRDPRFKITWDPSASLRISVDAIDGDQYFNGLLISVEINGVVTAVPQTAPGEYQITLPAPRTSQIVTVKNDSKVLDMFAVPGRYAPEFNSIGNDLENLKKLADLSGGSVIQPGPVHPIDFRWPVQQTSLLSECAFAGFIAIAVGMIVNKNFPP